MTDVLIEAKNLTLSYDQYRSITYLKKRTSKKVLKGLNFTLQKGEILGLIGRNGCGKSTTLSILANIISADSGEVVSNCKSISLLNFNSGMLSFLSGVDNIFLQGYYLGLSHKEILGLMDQIIEISELKENIYEPVSTYSSGMRAKLGFSVAYHSKSEVLLIDETLGVGDYAFKEKSTAMMKKKILNNSAAIIVSHDEGLLKEMCTRCLVLKDGVACFEGSAEESLNYYKNKL